MATKVVRFKEWYSKQPGWIRGTVIIVGGSTGVIVGIVAAPLIGAAASAAGLGAAAGTLGGAAASSAGLAALGGGSLAAGGLGMAGGTAVVAAVSSAATATGVAIASHKVAQDGATTDNIFNKAKNTKVDDDDFNIE